MNYGMPSAFILILLVPYSVFAEDRVSDSDRMPPTTQLEASVTVRTPGSSWESWLRHEERPSPAAFQGPAPNPRPMAPAASLSSSTGPGPGFIGPEPDGNLSRLRFNGE
jgi:hypothetical protein